MTTANISLRHRIAESVVGAIEWTNEDRGYCRCPGENLHTGATRRRHCMVLVNGAPTIKCVHSSCTSAVEEANRRLRGEIGKAERGEEWRPDPEELARCNRLREERHATEASKAELVRTAGKARARILERYAWPEVDAWEASPVRVDGRPEDDHRLFLRIFPADAVTWIGERHESGKPEHARNFRTAAEWCELPAAPAPLVCPGTFKTGSLSRSADNLDGNPFLVVEGDTIDEIVAAKTSRAAAIRQDLEGGRIDEAKGTVLLRRYALTEDDRQRNREACLAVIRWIAEECRLTLRAVVDAGNKSVHGWYDRPEESWIEEMATIAGGLGLDPATFRPSQPVRLPGWLRDTGRYQRLLYLNPGAQS
jgi:hypothetical protein